jgi:hypothetical protein
VQDPESLAQQIADGFASNGILYIEFLVSADTRTVYLIRHSRVRSKWPRI